MAQNVYSLNVVGYHTVTVPANGFALVANQLDSGNNTLASLIPNPPVDTIVYKYDNGWVGYTFDEFDEAWLPNGNATINPGEGVMIRNPLGTPLSITFVGEVLQGNLANPLPAGFAVRSSMVPQAGGITSVLGFPGEPDDIVYKYSGGYTGYTFDEFDEAWLPSEPVVAVGEAFFSRKVKAGSWDRVFSVPQ
jgi:hypothetical protein